MKMVLLTALGVGGATIFGSLIGFLFKKISHRFSDVVLSFAAGVMLSAAVLGLVLPSLEYGGKYGLLITIAGIFARNIIEVAPLAFMRGRTLNNAFIILDEAQNTTGEQMLMFLTRMGFGSRCVITGDPTQSDLVGNEASGLERALKTLAEIREIGFVFFSPADVVRHNLLRKIINAYNYREEK